MGHVIGRHNRSNIFLYFVFCFWWGGFWVFLVIFKDWCWFRLKEVISQSAPATSKAPAEGPRRLPCSCCETKFWCGRKFGSAANHCALGWRVCLVFDGVSRVEGVRMKGIHTNPPFSALAFDGAVTVKGVDVISASTSTSFLSNFFFFFWWSDYS